MAAATDTKIQLDDLVECSICTEVYCDPRSLPCIHSYCFKCIADWCKDKQPGDKIACPLCRLDFAIPDGGVGDIPKNFFIGKLLKIKELTNPEPEVKLCDICSAGEENSDKTSAWVFCLQCQQNLCKACSKFHSRMKTTSTHTVVNLGGKASVDELYLMSSSTFCDKHQNKPIEIYCVDCKSVLCMMCHIEDHNTHKCSAAAKVAGDFRVSLTHDLQSMTAAVQRFDEQMKTLKSYRNVFVDRVKNVEREICERAERLKAMIDDEKQKLLADLCEIHANHEKQMDSLAQEITQVKSLLESLNKYCAELVKNGTASDVIREASNLHRRSEELSRTEVIEDAVKDCIVVDVTILSPRIMLEGTASYLGSVIKEGLL